MPRATPAHRRRQRDTTTAARLATAIVGASIACTPKSWPRPGGRGPHQRQRDRGARGDHRDRIRDTSHTAAPRVAPSAIRIPISACGS
jgi:hypothetical protein